MPLAERIEDAEAWFTYYMAKYEDAREQDAVRQALDASDFAAKWAAILTALRAQEAHNG